MFPGGRRFLHVRQGMEWVLLIMLVNFIDYHCSASKGG